MNEATRTLVEMSLAARSIEDTFALFTQSLAVGVTKRQICEIRAAMVKSGRLRGPADGPTHHTNAEPLPANEGYERAAKVDGCQRLLKAQLRTGQYCGAQRAAWLARHGEAA